MRPARHLVVFLRVPRLGRVKSRLAAGIGPVAALQFHRTNSARLLRRLVRDRRWRLALWVTPDHMRVRWPVAAPRRGQGSGDLGQRMARVFIDLPPGPAVIIGADIPAITPDHIAAAFRALGHSEAVFGPATDGGYWLVGLRRRPRVPHGLFAAVRWSSADALADTLKGLPRGMSVVRLETLSDIDDADDYRHWFGQARRAASP